VTRSNGFHSAPDFGRSRDGRPASDDIDLHGLEPAELLDAVELDECDPRVARTRGMAREHGSLLTTLEGMREDRVALSAVGSTAPAGLVDAAIDAARVEAEREALLSIESTDPSFETPPVSKVVPPRRRLSDRLRLSPTTGWVAMAACVLLAVSLLAIEGARRAGVLLDAPPRLADVPSASTPSQVDDARVAEPGSALASAQDLGDPSQGNGAPRAFEPVADLAAAVDALSAGRLVVRVVARDAGAGTGWSDAIAGSRSDGLWSVVAEAPGVIVAALPGARDALPTDGPVYAGDHAGGHERDTRADARAPVPVRIGVAHARVARTRTALAALLAHFERAGFDASMESVADPLPSPVDLSPTALGWWNDPLRPMPARASVPVIVEAAP
jgi:hypothetical protein